MPHSPAQVNWCGEMCRLGKIKTTYMASLIAIAFWTYCHNESDEYP